MTVMRTSTRLGLSISALSLAGFVACAPGDTSGQTSGRDADTATPTIVTGTPHIMPLRGANLSTTPTNANLTYQGGPVLQNVKIFTIFWTSSVPNQAQLNQFYTAIVGSPYLSWLSEYNTPSGEKIGLGSFIGTTVDTGAPSGDVTNAQIAAEIERLIKAGTVPTNDANTLYMVHFPPGVNISLDSSDASCQQFCAYHNTASLGGKNLYFGVIPDLQACPSGCGNSGTILQKTTEVSSHELVEAITDAAVGLNDIAWYDNSLGEIGDICANFTDSAATVSGYTVQKEWSNKKKACIATDGSGGSGGSSGSGGSGATGGSGGSGGSCSHAVCSSGSSLKSTCDPCVTKICAQDSFCCASAWDSVCVGEVASICAESCGSGGSGGSGAGGSGAGGSGAGGGGSTCSHSPDKTGTKLKSTCDTTVGEVCASDSFCCNTKWDSTCVSEYQSAGGQ